jgi:hypothetical protein
MIIRLLHDDDHDEKARLYYLKPRTRPLPKDALEKALKEFLDCVRKNPKLLRASGEKRSKRMASD